MKFEFYSTSSQEIDRDVIASLWQQNVDMDDWDYMVFFAAKYKAQFPPGWDGVVIEPSNYNVTRLLNGSCRNKWWAVKDFRGKSGFLGVAYHA